MRKAFFVFAVIPALLVLAWAFPVMAAEEAPPEVPLEWVHGIWAAAKAAPVAIVMASSQVSQDTSAKRRLKTSSLKTSSLRR
jgi:hypothetical protein